MVGPSAKASCWEGSAAKAIAAGPALLGVPQHALGVVGADDDQVDAAVARHEGPELDVAGLAHRAGVEAGDLRVVVVGRADEPRGVLELGDPDARGVDVVALQPGAVVLEVGPGPSDEQRAQAEVAHPEADVRRDAAAPDLQLLDQEGQRDLVQLLDHQGVGEPAPVGHQVVGRDGPGDSDAHGGKVSPPCASSSSGAASRPPAGSGARLRGIRISGSCRRTRSCRPRSGCRS